MTRTEVRTYNAKKREEKKRILGEISKLRTFPIPLTIIIVRLEVLGAIFFDDLDLLLLDDKFPLVSSNDLPFLPGIVFLFLCQ